MRNILLILLIIFLAACENTPQTGDDSPITTQLAELEDLKARSDKSNEPLLNQLSILMMSIKENQGIPVNYFALEKFSKESEAFSTAKVQEIQKKNWHSKVDPIAESSLQREMQFSQLAGEDVPRMLKMLKDAEEEVSIEDLNFIESKLNAIEANQEKIDKMVQELRASLSQ